MDLLKTILVCLLCLILISFKQDNSSFSMSPPEDWYEIRNEELIDNLQRYKLSEEELRKYLASHNGSTLLFGYTKYKNSEFQGTLNPTIQVNLMKNTTASFPAFFRLMSKSAKDMGNYFHNYEFIDKPDSTLVAGKKAFYFCAKFEMISSQNDTIHVRSKAYVVPSGDIFYQINFTDGEGEDCSKLYDELVKTIRFE